jgi:xylan 1,4-beta-xylosidase
MSDATLTIDRAKTLGPLKRIWASIGYDELNWTTTSRGKEIHRILGSDVFTSGPYWVRMHNTFTSGNELSTPAWGAGNPYFEQDDGAPYYRWDTLDEVLDAIIEPGGIPLVELGFMPRDLSSVQQDGPAGNYTPAMTDYELGAWRYPPKDLNKWRDLVHEFVKHVVARYGEEHVAQWRFELWNEPDIRHYWRGTHEEYCALFEASYSGAKSAFAGAQVGGPGTTDKGNEFLAGFLTHLRSVGIVPDFLSFHTKGAYFSPYRLFDTSRPYTKDTPSTEKMLADIRASLDTISSFPELAGKPVYIDECDPAVGTIWGVFDNPNFVVTNSEHYPSFVAQLAGKLLDDDRVTFFTHWAFYFEGKRWFEGNRTLFDNENVEKPIVNGLRLLERLAPGTRIAVSSTHDEVGAIASDDEQALRILAWNHTDPWWVEGAKSITLDFPKLPAGKSATVTRLDRDHANTFRAWQAAGESQHLTPEQIAALKNSATLKSESIDLQLTATGASLTLDIPIHGLALIEIR